MPPEPAADWRPKPGAGTPAKPPRPHPGPGISARPLPPARPGRPRRSPGLFAFARRYPGLRRHAALAAIAGGVAVFAVAALSQPLADANVAAPPPPTGTPTGPVLAAVPPASSTPAAVKKLSKNPTLTKQQAPANQNVISGLAANGIPQVALNAYRVAAARMDNADPGCGIDWALLAGIGREESNHGQFGGAVLHANGDDVPHVIGPALDGVHWDYVPAPPNGLALDGDATYAHALGPMQFIPSTWAIYGVDGNGDGKADVFNIYDAALGAANYLCAAGGNLRNHDGLVQAVLAYNHSDQYLAQVLALADAYRRGISIVGIPVGITSGALPPVKNHGAPPPANPGPPTAVSTDKVAAAPKPTPTSSGSSTGKSGTPSASASTGDGAAQVTFPAQPTSSSSSDGSSGSSSAPPPSSSSASPTPSQSPTPSSTTSCSPLDQLFHRC